jgi:flagellin-like hook-associated protein FlgL
MSIVINSNMTASHSALNMSRANDLLKKSMLRLSSGKRIISPADDAGGLAVGMKLQSQLRRTAATKQNIQNGVSFLQMQDGTLKVTGEILDRMAELKSFFNDVSKNGLDRETYNHEFKELQAQLVELQSSKFNGVSLFARTEPDNNPMKIVTTEDGLTGKVELHRTGLFENLKSKYGADGELNSGSHGEYRQLVGNFTIDGGLLDSSPGKTSRDYGNGDVVYMKGVSLSDSGYFMTLGDVKAGTSITDTGKATSNWIRLADRGGEGFAEAFPSSPDYDSTTTKYNSRGEKVAYLKGDVVRVPAHWANPGSYLFLEAQADVPQGIALERVFNDDHVGENKFFNYVGQDRSNGAITGDKPTTEYVRANSNLAEPSLYTPGTADLKALMAFNSTTNHTPGYVKVGTDVYVANSDWNAKTWTAGVSFKEGDLIFDENPGATGLGASAHVKELSSKVKGIYTGAAAAKDDYVIHRGNWFQASTGLAKSTVPADPASLTAHDATAVYDASSNVSDSGFAYAPSSTSGIKGAFDASNVAQNDVVVSLGTTAALNKWYKIDDLTAGAGKVHADGDWDGSTVGQDYSANDILRDATDGLYYKKTSAGTLSGAATNQSPGLDVVNWTLATASDLGTDVDSAVKNVTDINYWTQNPWTKIANPEDQAGFARDVTAEYQDVTNTSHWSKTHFGKLTGKTVSASYTRGDNISHQGKHYVYVSHLDSDDPSYVSPSDDGYTEFGDLLRLGALKELSMYVDTKGGGGGAELPQGVFYKANQSLDYVDRLSNTGTVRTNTIARRTDSPLPPGDEIYNSQDDQFYGGLNAGNDGIFGTMDDFYATTSDPAIAKSGSHVDADADNNKDLLDSKNSLQHFSVADFVDYIQSLANFRAVNGGTMSRLGYAEDMLEENEINLEAATSRIMDADMAAESTKLARQNVLVQASASMVSQANQMANIVLSLLQ